MKSWSFYLSGKTISTLVAMSAQEKIPQPLIFKEDGSPRRKKDIVKVLAEALEISRGYKASRLGRIIFKK